ncbi:uncharacterized protein (DUF427 family) [Marmoricola sp. OAE513]|uniref:DUF427 domain-containing protein n=1 Tax=Marmoricola sp. OAE513 TaxID=2817894 RepID=UPI001AE54AFD
MQREVPGPGQESVWDYPRPPRLEQRHERVRVVLGGVVIAETTDAWCVLETSHPPTYYLPRNAFLDGSLRGAPGTSFCEWKGDASYLDLLGGGAVAQRSAWTYADPTPGFAVITDHVALYPAAVDACFVDDERVEPQPGGFYGGWITSRVVGPFKGAPGTLGW